MINLVSTSDKLQVITSAAGDVDVHASYVDWDGAAATPGRKNTAAITTATTTDVVLAPASNVFRNVKYLSVQNVHASVANIVTVQHTDGTNVVVLFDITLQPGEKSSWVEGIGLRVFDTEGREKSPTPGPVTTKVLLADQSNSTVTPTEVTGLTIPVGVGVYQFQYIVRYQAGATTTGVRFSVNHDGTVAWFLAQEYWVDNSATASTAAADQDAVGAAGQVVGAMAARAKSVAGWGTTISVDTINADMMMMICGTFEVTVAGNLELWHGSEVAAISTVKAGSSLVLTKVS